jgi:hypothetical protein
MKRFWPAVVVLISASALAGVSLVVTIGGVTPASGPTTGGTGVTITGSGFTEEVTGGSIGGVPFQNFVVINDTTISAVTPPHAPGSVSVTLNLFTGATVTRPNAFVYVVPGAGGPTLSPAMLLLCAIALGAAGFVLLRR